MSRIRAENDRSASRCRSRMSSVRKHCADRDAQLASESPQAKAAA
jgi:hypothetical protein